MEIGPSMANAWPQRAWAQGLRNAGTHTNDTLAASASAAQLLGLGLHRHWDRGRALGPGPGPALCGHVLAVFDLFPDI